MHLVEIEPEILQHQDAIQLRQLRHRVIAVARLRVGMRRRQQPDLVIKTQQACGDSGDPRELSDPEHADLRGIGFFYARLARRKSLRRPIDATTVSSRRSASRMAGCRTVRSYSAAKRGKRARSRSKPMYW